MAGNTVRPGETLASRLLTIMECFDVTEPALTLTEIARKADLPISTTRRILAELVQRGWLERRPDNRYRVGLQTWKIGSLSFQPRSIREAAVPLMHDLYEATHQTVQLAVLDEHSALCIEKISGPQSVSNETTFGGRLPLHATGVGKCLLAAAPPPLTMEIFAAGLHRYTPRTIIAPGRLYRNIQEVRRLGIAYSYEELTVGVISVASSIPIPGDVNRVALGIVASADTPLDQLAPAVRTAALMIARIWSGEFGASSTESPHRARPTSPRLG